MKFVFLSDIGFSKDEVVLFNEMGEVILFKMDMLGVKEVNVGVIMVVLVVDCYMFVL